MQMQLSLLNLIDKNNPDHGELSALFNISNLDKAKHLRALAESMQSKIDQNIDPAIGNQRVTKRRQLIAQGMIEKGIELEVIQSWLLAIAQMWESGNIPEVLRGIKSKSQVETLRLISKRNSNLQKIQEMFDNENYQDWITILNRAGLHSAREILSAIAEIEKVVKPQVIDTTKQKLKKLELEIIGMKDGDFFPTPEAVCRRLIQLANIETNWRIIEPSAGNGNIAEFITKSYPQVKLDVVEINFTLRKILELKGFNLVGGDFLEFNSSDRYNTCIMNPPFLGLIEHIYHAWELLAPNGILVSIVSESVFCNRKYQKFKDWLNDNGAYIEKLDKNAFISSNNPTSVNTRIVKLIKS